MNRFPLNAKPIDGFLATSVIVTPPTIIGAILTALSTGCGVAFGDSADSQKFFAEHAPQSARPPYAVVKEGEAAAEAQSIGGLADYLDLQTFTVRVYAGGETSARELTASVVSALQDAPLVNLESDVLEFAPSAFREERVSATGPGIPVIYRHEVDFLGRLREI